MKNNRRFINVTPAQSLLGQSDPASHWSVAEFRNRIYLAEIVHDASPPRDRCRIIAYRFDRQQWETVYSEPSVARPGGIPSPTVTSAMRVVREPGKNDSALFVRFASPRGSFLLRMGDGSQFQQVSDQIERLEQYFSCHRLVAFDSRLAGLGPDDNGDLNRLLEFSADGRSWHWQELPGLGVTDNRSLSGIVEFSGALYAATINSERGFEIWKAGNAAGEGRAWTTIVDRGAYRYVHNQQVFSMVAHDGALFLATGTPLEEQTPESKFFDYQGFEIIRLDAGGHWDLMVGVPRFSPFGLIVPLSGLGPGLDPRRKRGFRGLVEYAGRLLMGVQDEEGFRLWMSATGEHWELVAEADFAEIYQVDRCRMLSSGDGLMLALETTDAHGHQEVQIWAGDIVWCNE